MTEKGLKKLIELEGFKREVYNDVAGLPTIGVGHLLTQDELSSGKICFDNYRVIDYRKGITEQEVHDILENDLKFFEHELNSAVLVPLNDDQRDALTSFIFNIGPGAFKNSTLLKVLNRGDYHLVPEQLERWIYAGGKVIQGLINRREQEIKMWLGE